MNLIKLLVIDERRDGEKKLKEVLARAGFESVFVQTKKEAEDMTRQQRPALVVMNLLLPDATGHETMVSLRAISPSTQFVAIAGPNSLRDAARAMRAGAADFLVSPVRPQELVSCLSELRALRHPTDTANADRVPFLTGKGAAIREVNRRVHSAARTNATAFVTGERYVGKRTVAQIIHNHSAQRDGPFVEIDCQAEDQGDLRERLLGDGSQDGALAQAVGGTLFLNEVCALDHDTQVALKNHLDRPSTLENLPRLICATARDPLTEVEAERFDAELFYRLFVLPIQIPPLSQRGQDLLQLADDLLKDLTEMEGRDAKHLSHEARAVLLEHDWPGNLLELRNMLWNVVVLHDGDLIEAHDLPETILQGAPPAEPSHTEAADPYAGRTLAEIERNVIETAIAREHGSIPRAARSLGLSPSTVYRKLDAWGMTPRTA